ncbi:MAG TPA: 3-deoxy-7-phosphoheptulonate synthase, partial [Gammaproteobacteria bacterium]|nr:3-deoxy-7-phosphoheptulonate synthase [Gammaproteobacteria bacterium]
GSSSICGVMLESYLVEGKQEIKPKQKLIYGQSITDACIGWKETAIILEKLALARRKRTI